MDIKQEFREEKNMDVYATNVNDGSFSNVYVKWLEAKLTLTDVGYPLCACGGNERIAMDCTRKSCEHPKYAKSST
jgi:hypothetical protein